MLTQGFRKFYGSITEAAEAPKTIFQKRGGACRPVASSLSNPTSKMFWKGLDLNCYLHPYLDKFTPPFLCFWLFSFRNLTKLYGFRKDIHFLFGMLRNFTDYATIPSSASGMLQNFTDCAIMFPFDSRHVAELHGLPNDGCQVPQTSQARVASQQTDGPQTKLGYDSCPSLLVFYWR